MRVAYYWYEKAKVPVITTYNPFAAKGRLIRTLNGWEKPKALLIVPIKPVEREC